MERETFLDRVRTCLERGGGALPRPAPHRPPAPPPRDERVERFVRELEAVGGVVHRAASASEAREAILGLLHQSSARRVIRDASPILEELALDGFEVTVADFDDEASRGPLRDAAFAADVGVTSADFGVAETGTLALLARRGHGRAVSLLPPVHVAVLAADAVVGELAELFERVTAGGADLPSALTLITGPSRTGDIELVLTVGVHGPKELHVILIS